MLINNGEHGPAAVQSAAATLSKAEFVMTVSLLSGQVARSPASGEATGVNVRTRSPRRGRLTLGDTGYRTLLGTREEWWEEAACRGMDVEVFFPLPNDTMNEQRALRICGRCPIRAKCQQYAVRNREAYGIWGGTTERQRAALMPRYLASGGSPVRAG